VRQHCCQLGMPLATHAVFVLGWGVVRPVLVSCRQGLLAALVMAPDAGGCRGGSADAPGAVGWPVLGRLWLLVLFAVCCCCFWPGAVSRCICGRGGCCRLIACRQALMITRGSWLHGVLWAPLVVCLCASFCAEGLTRCCCQVASSS
jgi:hypothetical protein